MLYRNPMVNAILNKSGYTRIGNGLYSDVYARGTEPFVIKVSNDTQNWPTYIQWANECGYAGGFAPMVYRYQLYDGFFIAVMERFEWMLARHPIDDVDNFFHQAWTHLEPRFPGLNEFMAHACHDLNIGDLHGGNIMLNADATRICLIDPSSRPRPRTLPRRFRSATSIMRGLR